MEGEYSGKISQPIEPLSKRKIYSRNRKF